MHPVDAERSGGLGGDVDVAILGAGAAGIAAARACLAGGLSVLMLEARHRIGGRAVTVRLAGHPVDLGAHWLHAGTLNPLVRLGLAGEAAVRRAPGETHLVVQGRRATIGERHAHGAGFGRMERAFAEAARHEVDRAASKATPLLGRWREPVLATHALVSGRPLAEVSVKDYPSDEFGDNYFVAGGYGSYLARLGRGVPVALKTAVTSLDWSGQAVRVETSRGTLRARRAILTIPVAVLQAGGVQLRPRLPAAHEAAIAGFLPGSYEHVVMNWPEAPFRGPDRLAKLVDPRRSLGLMTRLDGAPFHYMELDHATASGLRDAAAGGRFARAVLAEHFGARALADLRVLAVTEWRRDPWSRSAWAVVPPGLHAIRAALRVAVAERVWFAGEATSDGQWGTVGGAWEEGERAAREVLDDLGGRRPL